MGKGIIIKTSTTHKTSPKNKRSTLPSERPTITSKIPIVLSFVLFADRTQYSNCRYFIEWKSMIVENNTFIPTATNPSYDEDIPRMLRRDADQIQC